MFRWSLCFIGLFFPLISNAAVYISEVAWPYTHLVVVLILLLFLAIYIATRTQVRQSVCLGKMGLLAVLLITPVATKAAVYISEVAWMGDEVSANNEWIELHNDGSATDVTGWQITDGDNLEIELEGTIPAGKRVVLERTSEESSRAEAFLIYTGALVNSGATLKLLREDGSVEDQVSGGEDWQSIGGDNESKETAQYTTSGWVTADRTPGAPPDNQANQTQDETDDTEETDSDNDDESEDDTSNIVSSGEVRRSSGSSEPKILNLPPVTLDVAISAPDIGYVNQEVSFTAQASDAGETMLNSLQYEWNFGDASALKRTRNEETKHVFKYPGTYVVNVYAHYKRQEQTARHEITILPVKMSLGKTSAGDIQIHNDSAYEINIENYRLVAEDEVVFPPRSVILPKQTITIAEGTVGDSKEVMVALYDNEDRMVSSLMPDQLAKKETDTEEANKPPPRTSSHSVSRQSTVDADFNFSGSKESTETNEVARTDEPNEQPEATSTQLAAVGATEAGDDRTTYLALAGVLLVATLGVFAVPRGNQNA